MNTFLDIRQPELTGLEGTEAIQSMQKVLEHFETHVSSEPRTLAEEEEDWEYNIDKEQYEMSKDDDEESNVL